MRVYNVFIINNHFSKLYKNKPRTLFQMLEQINKVNKKDYTFAFKLFEQIALPYNKKDICSYIDRYKNRYLKVSDNTYVTDGVYNCEVTKVVVGTSRIRIITNKNDPYIFKILQEYSDYLYICDFDTDDYFWLNRINIKEE